MAPSQAWAGKPAWRVLDTAFGDGRRFLNTWQAWAEDPHTPRLLHYVAITPLAPDGDALLRALSSHPEIAAHSPDLVHQSFGFLRGFHRIALHQARVLLTVCVGELQAMLREQQFVADAVYLTALPDVSGPQSWDRWRIKALTRLCRRGTAVEITRATSQLRDDLAQAGFVFEEPAPEVASASSLAGGNALLHGQYQPRWEPGSTRDNWRAAAPTVSSCVVIGAGLAGALVARALARRGWQVTVLDAAEQPAAGASGLPVGLLAPQVSRDDSTRSRLSRAGLRATLAQCHALLQHGEDWAYPGVLELRPDACLGLPDGWPLSGRQWSDARPNDVASDTWTQGLVNGATSIWHTRAGWVKPSRLVQACLAHDRVRFVGNSKVHAITREDGQWILQNAQGAVLAGAPQLVIAAACDSLRLLDAAVANDRPTLARTGRLQDMAAVGGQISWAMHQTGDATAFPPFPVSGRGSFVAHVPWQGKRAWFTGATYEPGVTADFNHAAGRRENLERLSGLLPAVAKVLARRFADGQVQAWSGTRCTTIDRLPAVGPLEAGPQPGLWISAGMGSRGLTYAALCAEVLAAQLGGEPFSIESSLSRGLAAGRLQPTAPARPL